ncbi:MAG: ATP-binding protein, partial [Chloroflexota bacterium]
KHAQTTALLLALTNAPAHEALWPAGRSAQPAFEASYPARRSEAAEIRGAVADVARAYGADERAQAKIKLGVSEAASNAVLHAYRDGLPVGEIHVLVDHFQSSLCVSVLDRGVGMSPRIDSPGVGLGLSLMATVSESCEIKSPASGGTEVVMRFDLGCDA